MTDSSAPPSAASDAVLLGQRLRHFRTQRGLTLAQLAERVAVSGSQLSLVETGRREPRLSLLHKLASALDIEVSSLLSEDPPNERAALEIELVRVQKGSLYRSLALPQFKVNKGLSTPVLRAFLGLYRDLARRRSEASATPEEARRANTEQRRQLREHNAYLPDIEEVAGEMLRIVGHRGGALTHSSVSKMARHLGFELIHVGDLPHSARSVSDLANGRIYLPPASIPGGHGLRSLALQAMAHRLLGHARPVTYADFLRQRLEINYFAAACLMPLDPAVAFLQDAQRERDMSVEDFRDGFGVTHEAAALRFTNLLTSHLDIRMHFLRVLGDGSIQKAYENDDLPLPTDVTGAVEGQVVCRYWSARSAFSRTNRTTEYYQYVDTPAGTFWSASQTGTTSTEEFSITVGVPFAEARFFRGRSTDRRELSRCPDESCCRRAPANLATRWEGKAWPSARLHAHVLAPLPSGTFPGIDDAEVYEFLDAHARES
ncbi:helix-turn-helix domain-containing protein [Rathayibacter toxicus]|uniref:Helix-turn-helix domain-containing protein n=1 Tax=Rathayibacter toxicus TaxID=145458 RepID=A0A0U1PW54_9MICO|nr:helix-turn-helix domain-containing protein [Rathayibacter toxicus]ALS57713.1 XRE family transcriptional regulator [Rathayibacter toxicus]KKM47298.1 XRE family transcriptional regulator [Rathayibacter toxicus]PPG20616.1 helix-turn-helix domain-containing protein [Rathayibacter toxicus]PPG45719.1 helix-turn-helix domain-containing protein [Rathayibacter toxicus]PPH21667.1 helix-turn-helix domain-containing protein [Rathayibacter toxicus]